MLELILIVIFLVFIFGRPGSEGPALAGGILWSMIIFFGIITLLSYLFGGSYHPWL